MSDDSGTGDARELSSGDLQLIGWDGAVRGEDDGHARALPHVAFEIHAAAMHFDKTLDDRKPQPRAAFGGRDVGPAMPQTVEKIRLIFRSDADAGVANA